MPRYGVGKPHGILATDNHFLSPQRFIHFCDIIKFNTAVLAEYIAELICRFVHQRISFLLRKREQFIYGECFTCELVRFSSRIF